MGILSKCGSPAATTIYAALHEDLSAGFVWLKRDDLRPRCVVKITNTENGHHVFCEALQLDANFLDEYNNRPRTLCIGSPESSIVMSYWYRAKLGDRDKPLECETSPALRIAAARPWARRWWGKLRACMNHPQLAMRVAVWLALLSIALAIIGVVHSVAPGNARRLLRPQRTAALPTSTAAASLSIDALLAWRAVYGDLLGKPREAVLERFGSPESEEGRALSWEPSARTKGRSVSVLFGTTEKSGTVKLVKVFAGTTESLDPMEILKKAPMFTFGTGTYRDALTSYFTAQTKDERNAFQFDVAEAGVRFRSMMFMDK
jgi:hypothetical protein